MKHGGRLSGKGDSMAKRSGLGAERVDRVVRNVGY